MDQRKNHLYQESCAYLLQHIGEKHNIKSLAKNMGSNHTTLSKVFNSYAGVSPMKWLRIQRLLRARELIRSTDLTIQDIGFELGYSYASTFTVTYKAKFHIAPSKERSY